MRNPSVCVYCGSNEGSDPLFRSSARLAAHALASRGIGIIYGGGARGLMGEVAAAAIAAGAPLTGVVPNRFRSDRPTPQEGARSFFVETMQERKELMRNLADGFIALPGGIGTLDEVAETLMLRSLRFHDKPIALLNVGGFFDPLVALFEAMTQAGFMKRSLRESILVSQDPEALVQALLDRLGFEA